MKLSNPQLFVLLLLLFSLPACGSRSAEPSHPPLKDINKILAQQTKLINEWAREFSRVFTEQNRAQFPSNRDWLNTNAKKIVALIDDSDRLGNQAFAKFEEASRLMTKEQDKRGMILIASSFKKESEISRLFKAQAQLASDETINDAKTFNEKFVYLTGLIYQKQKEKDDEFAEGKRLLLMQ